MLNIYTKTIFAAVMIDAILLCPLSIIILLLQPFWLFHPLFWDIHSLMVSFSFRLLSCYCFTGYGTGSRVESIIWPPLASYQWTRRCWSNSSNNSSRTSECRSISQKKATVVASGNEFITPNPTKSWTERRSLTWNSSSSSLKLKSYWSTSILKRINGSIRFLPG